jgi:hypothetical protein
MEMEYFNDFLEEEYLEEEEELIDDDTDDDENIYAMKMSKFPPFENVISSFETLATSERFQLKNTDLINCRLLIPRFVLPIAEQYSYGFHFFPEILEISFNPYQINWEQKPSDFSCKHPALGEIYSEHALVEGSIKRFFSPNFQPAKHYFSAFAVISIVDKCDEDL